MYAALGIANSIWWRSRWMLTAAVVYLCMLAVGVRVFPEAAPLLCVGTLALSFVWANLLTTLTYGPANFGSRNSGFPTHMLVLPIPVRALVGWPMLYGIATSAGLWWLTVTFVLAPGRVAAPMVWPAVLFAATTAWVQALAWTPFPSPLIRAPLLVLVVVPIVFLGILSGMELHNDMVSFWVSAIGIGWTAIAYAVGVQGLARARCGHQADWTWIFAKRAARWRQKRSSQDSEPFASAAAAQFWHEFSRNAIGLPFLTVLVSFIFLPLLIYDMVRPNPVHLSVNSIMIKPELLSLGLMILFQLMLSGMAGIGMGKMDAWGKEQMPAFFATRPVRTLRYVLIKFKAAAAAAASSWCILLIVVAIWAVLDIGLINRHTSLVRTALSEATPRSIAIAVLCCVGLPLFMWRTIVSGLWVSLAGQKWLSTMVGLGAPLGLFFVFPCIAERLYRHPTIGDQILALAPVIATALVALKLCTAAVIGIVLKRLELASDRDLAITFAIWAVTTGIVLLLISCFIPLTAMIAAIVILIVPLARIAAAPLALYWNRHR